MSQTNAILSESHSASVVKAKRKRNRRKKSKTSSQAVDGVPTKANGSSTTSTAASTFDGSVTSESSTQGGIDDAETALLINPPLRPASSQDVLRKSLVLKGFSLDEIDEAVIEMWDKQLPYDEEDAVLAYLEHCDGADGQVNMGTSRDDTKEKCQSEETDDSTNNDPSTEDTLETEEQGEDGEIDDSDSDDEAEAMAPAITMAEKLDMVAGFESLADSIFALSQWVNKAAKPQEIEDLCLAEKTQALATIIQRGIVECKEQSTFDSTVLPGVARLLFGVYKSCGIDYSPDELEIAEESMETLLRQARKVTLMNHEDHSDYGGDHIAEGVARFVVSSLAGAMEEAKMGRSRSSIGSIYNHPPSSTNRLNAGSSSDVVSKREMQKVVLQRAGVELRSTMNAASGTAKMRLSLAPNGNTKSATIENALDILINKETKDSFDQQRARLEELKAEVTDSESEKLLELRAAVTSVKDERLAVQEKIAELKASLEKLNLQDEELAIKIGCFEGDIIEEERKALIVAEEHTKMAQKAQDAVKYANSVRSLAGMLNTYGKSIRTATARSKEAALKDSKQADELAVKKMDMYLRDVRSYFMTEALYAGQLVTRLDSTRNDLGSLKSELEQCVGLGMTSTTAQIEMSIAAMNSKIDGDSKLLESVSTDALAMFDELLSSLQQYTTTNEKESWKLQAAHSILLLDVIAAVKMLDISNWERLQGFLQKIVPADSRDATMQPAGSALNSFPGANVQVRPKASLKTTTKQNSAPKLSWASVGKASVLTLKTSLLDIQKEELASRGDS